MTGPERCRPRPSGSLTIVSLLASLVWSGSAWGAAHTWVIQEVFSNADGTIQYIELFEPPEAPNNETGVVSQLITSNTRGFTIGGSVVGSTGGRSFLIATEDFAALSGAPTPDATIPASQVPFFDPAGDTIAYGPYDSWTLTPGSVPTNGTDSLDRTAGVGLNSPENFAGVTGSVDASGTPTAVPSGSLLMTIVIVMMLAGAGRAFGAWGPRGAA